jgi:hypothetical protein
MRPLYASPSRASTVPAEAALASPEYRLKPLPPRVIRERFFGQDYAKTLAIWRNNFRAASPNLMPLGFDDRLRRLRQADPVGKYRCPPGGVREVKLAALHKSSAKRLPLLRLAL